LSFSSSWRHPYRRQIRHARLNSAFSIGNRNNLNTSSTPSGKALIKSLFNEGAVFLAALNMGTGDSGRDEKSHEEDCRCVWLGLIYRNFSCLLQPCLGGRRVTKKAIAPTSVVHFLADLDPRAFRLHDEIHGALGILSKKDAPAFCARCATSDNSALLLYSMI
jgi:hypothetical protein